MGYNDSLCGDRGGWLDKEIIEVCYVIKNITQHFSF